MSLEGVRVHVFSSWKSWGFLGRLGLRIPMMCLRFEADCGHFNHLSPSVTSYCSSILYICNIWSIPACLLYIFIPWWQEPQLGLAQQNWWGSWRQSDGLCFIMIKCFERSSSLRDASHLQVLLIIQATHSFNLSHATGPKTAMNLSVIVTAL